ncbi:unnamed protein product [Cuscuta epithymum]|uniref:Uncharacterized protein n=1 Tax=Cuscuta epithymum TaxID=186058 RepID=A0AAV0DL48_9ASTE|nr:unnamed protein product [Cuscuta epithymum]
MGIPEIKGYGKPCWKIEDHSFFSSPSFFAFVKSFVSRVKLRLGRIVLVGGMSKNFRCFLVLDTVLVYRVANVPKHSTISRTYSCLVRDQVQLSSCMINKQIISYINMFFTSISYATGDNGGRASKPTAPNPLKSFVSNPNLNSTMDNLLNLDGKNICASCQCEEDVCKWLDIKRSMASLSISGKWMKSKAVQISLIGISLVNILIKGIRVNKGSWGVK